VPSTRPVTIANNRSVTLASFMAVAQNAFRELSTASSPVSDRTLLAGIGLSSFSALLLELSLTRLFSVVLFYHFAFLAISIALLGLGAGGVYAHLRKEPLNATSLRAVATICAASTAIAIPIALEVILHVPVSLKLTAANFLRVAAIYAFAAVPFFLTGLQFSVVFARESAKIPRLYGADLAGGALACVAIVPLLNRMGGPNVVLLAGLVAALAAVVWSPASKYRRRTLGLATAIILLIVLNRSGRVVDVVWAKGILQENVEFSRWNAISRVEVDHAEDGSKRIVIDADAATSIMNADPRNWEGSRWQTNLMTSPAAVANALRPHGDYAIIGPGGGVDVLRAVANGSPSVTGIEINPIIADTIMRGRYADFAYHLYQRPQVHIHVADGRSFIRSSTANYDVVEMTLVDTWASTAAGAFALSENNLYTTQAFREYFDHLKPDGMIAITRWEFQVPREALRVASLATETLHQLGINEVSRHFIVVSQDELDEDGINVSVLAKKSEFTPQEENALQQFVARHPPLQVLYSPSGHQDNAFSQLIASNDPYSFSHGYPYNVTPVTDNAPFFFFTLKTGQIFRRTHHSMDWKVNLGVTVLAMLLVISVVAVLAFLVLPLLIERIPSNRPAPALLYFVAIGLGYILVEVSFIQRFVLFLGHPTYALTVVIFLLLLSSGAGSVASHTWLSESRRVWIPLLVICAALIVYIGILPGLLDRFVGAAFLIKLLISGFLLVPLGFAMGMPFPTGLRAVAETFETRSQASSIEWAWAMNAASSVLGSVLAIVVAVQFGLNVTLTCGAAAYALALLLKPKLRARTSGA
jgi:spermidine synthase